ncbi:MAG: ShlB/FhaC/HecB family hemolysin secretion/activation protein [Pseudomonadales bacterium]
MKLSPETVRLRRVAKAHALGEFSMAEYRQARREVIDNFEPHRPDDDDTQPRLESPQDNGGQAIMDARAPSRRRSRWLVWLLAAVAVVAATRLFAAEPAWIPAVVERDPNPATSPRLAVSTVQLAHASSLEGLAVTEAELQAVIDGKLEEIRLRNQPGSHGFTGPELAEIGRFLNALGAHQSGNVLSAEDAADLSELLADQKLRRGVSVVELEEVAVAVQTYLREAGYILAVAFVPAQEVTQGRVDIGFLPGVLGDVRVEGAPEKLARRFDDLIGRPVTRREINTRLYALNQAPGFSARAGFEPGDGVGETRLNLDVLEQRALHGSVMLDNYGDDHTGRRRLVLAGDLINPAGRGDVLSVGLTAAIDPDNELLGFAEYATPVGGRRQLRGRLARNEFNTGGVDDVEADGWLFDAVLETYLYRDRLTGLSWELGVGRHELGWQTPAGDVDQSVTLVSGALNARRVWDSARIAADFRLYADAGSIDGDTFAGQDSGFWDLGFQLFGWHPFDVGFLPGRQKASIELSGQMANTQLPSTRRLALGGIGGARGFERDQYLADRALLVRGELRTSLALGELAVFADAAYGKIENELTPGWAYLADLGVAWEVRFGAHFLSSISWATPITAKGEGGLNDEGDMLFWSLRYIR